ncbi:DUF2288 domain-containing protein [Luteolibacter pohnpeiensis]|uniref:DUF2288 domain-containing protein n=1 Tax=Luteolibacter pohnpeiensis TaxID=454153 RepID=A0A934VVA3_9BACT|nr:DUF2288 domain-containing protein [Luteolibacter pohnpeiensis]MBK1881329.1 DUF2288 domain-containing protein [Luteolibacter pohnpeiensis]
MISPDSSTSGEPAGSGSSGMKYLLLGKDESTDQEKLAKYKGEVDWTYLKPHFERGCLFFVDPDAKLEEVGAAIAANETERVQNWLASGDLVKIEALHANQWEGGTTQFEALVVSPFVLCRPVVSRG